MFLKSIRGRLLAWFGGFMLLGTAGSGWMVARMHWLQSTQSVDRELERWVSRISVALRTPGLPDGRSPRGDNRFREPRGGASPQGRPFPEGRPPFEVGPPPSWVPPAALETFDDTDPNAPYFLVWWRGGGAAVRASRNAPVVARPWPTGRDTAIRLRSRADWREAYHFTELGDCILVGRSLTPELAMARRFDAEVAAAATAVLAVALGGGAWLITRALRPIDEISAAALRISAGQLDQRVRGAGRASELGRLVQVLNATFARLESAFAQQRQFTADASHELRTPLAAMITDAQSVLTRPREAGEYRAALERSLAAAHQMKRLASTLLDLARLDAGAEAQARDWVDLSDVAAGCLEAVEPLAAAAGIVIDRRLDPAPTRGDRDRLLQVALNLVGNAIRYNHSGGGIRVETAAEGGSAVLTVKDTGQGIAPADLPHIFDRFYRAAASRGQVDGGSGLGLAIVEAIVKSHGGVIEAASELGKGSTFTVRLVGVRPA